MHAPRTVRAECGVRVSAGRSVQVQRGVLQGRRRVPAAQDAGHGLHGQRAVRGAQRLQRQQLAVHVQRGLLQRARVL